MLDEFDGNDSAAEHDGYQQPVGVRRMAAHVLNHDKFDSQNPLFAAERLLLRLVFGFRC